MLRQENTYPDQRAVIAPADGKPTSPRLAAAAHLGPVVHIQEDPVDDSPHGPEEELSRDCFNDDVDPNAEVTDETLQLWLRRCRRKFLTGVTVIKVANNGKLVKRQLYINAKPEYIELISSKLFDTAYHLSSVESATCSLDSPDFDAFRELQPGCMPKQEKSLVVRVGGRYLSLVFQSSADRRDAQIYLTALAKMLLLEGADRLREFELTQTMPALRTHRENHWGTVVQSEQ